MLQHHKHLKLAASAGATSSTRPLPPTIGRNVIPLLTLLQHRPHDLHPLPVQSSRYHSRPSRTFQALRPIVPHGGDARPPSNQKRLTLQKSRLKVPEVMPPAARSTLLARSMSRSIGMSVERSEEALIVLVQSHLTTFFIKLLWALVEDLHQDTATIMPRGGHQLQLLRRHNAYLARPTRAALVPTRSRTAGLDLRKSPRYSCLLTHTLRHLLDQRRIRIMTALQLVQMVQQDRQTPPARRHPRPARDRHQQLNRGGEQVQQTERPQVRIRHRGIRLARNCQQSQAQMEGDPLQPQPSSEHQGRAQQASARRHHHQTGDVCASIRPPRPCS